MLQAKAIVLLVAAALSALASGAASPTLAQATAAQPAEVLVDPDPLPESDPMVLDLAQEQGIDAAQASRRLAWQENASLLEGDFSTAFRGHYGGVWIDQDDGGRIKVGIVGLDDAPDLKNSVWQRLNDLGIADFTDVVPVPNSHAVLQEAGRWLGVRLEAVNAGAEWPLESAVQLRHNRVVLRIAEDGELTTDQEVLIESARQRYGTTLHLEGYTGKAVAGICRYPYCDPPLRAGVRINRGSGFCSLGFIARSRSDNKLYAFTAGHCASQHGTGTWATRFSDRSVHDIGPVHNWRWNGDGDMAILRVNNPAGWRARAWVYVRSSDDTNYDAEYHISSDGSRVEGGRICLTGASSSTDCGEVIDKGATVTYDGVTVRDLTRTDTCAERGDSGGPIYAYHRAYGLYVAFRSGQCVNWYQEILTAEDGMRVNVAHES